MNKINIIVLISAFIALGCKKEISETEFQQDVFDKVFPAVIDSTFIDQRLYTCFPEQGKPLYSKTGKWIGFDSIGQKKRDFECEIKRASLKKDTLNLIVAIGNGGLFNEKTNLQKYRTQKFIFKHLNEFPDDHLIDFANWKAKYKKFAGAMYFSKINFDKKQTSGTINVSYSCGGKCGLGYLVTIKKIKEKWIVVKVENTSIS